MSSKRVFAIIPAAGVSQRMGKPKLLLSWNGQTIVEKLVNTIKQSGVFEILVVTRPDDVDLQTILKQLPVITVIPETPPEDMKASVQRGLERIEKQFNITDQDAWMLTPADYPLVQPSTVNTILNEWKHSEADILIPVYKGQKGHPILLKWKLAKNVFNLRENEGVNSVINDEKWVQQLVSVNDSGILQDIDTPEDYQKYLQ